MKSFNSCLVTAVLVSSTFTSCLENDMFDSSYSSDDFLISNVDKTFDWSMFTPLNVQFKASDDYDGKYYYRIDIYDMNPDVYEEASLFAVGVCKKDINFNVNLIIPAALEKLCVVQTAPNGKTLMKEIDLTNVIDYNVVIECDFNYSDTQIVRNARSATKSSSDILEDYNNYNTPSDAIAITENKNITLNSNTSYVISAGME